MNFFCVSLRFLRARLSNLNAIGKKTTWKTYPCKWKTFPYKRRSSPRTWKAFPYRFFLMRRKLLSRHSHFQVGAAVFFRHFAFFHAIGFFADTSNDNCFSAYIRGFCMTYKKGSFPRRKLPCGP